jgi:hypothetical protein
MVSEDSQNIRWFAPIHRLCDLRDLCDPRDRPMLSQLHQINDVSELVEVIPLRCSQLMHLKERNYHVMQVRSPRNAIAAQICTVIVLSSII